MSAVHDIESGARFAFGENWTHFVATMDEQRIHEAVESLQVMLGVETLEGKTFLDAGCGSGLFSLAARRLGASVHSFDFDPQSVSCTQELQRRYSPRDSAWRIEHGSVLDQRYVEGLGRFDVVYSWGVLHHTGAMWLAIENVIARVALNDGKLFIAIYNDQGWKSHAWWMIKFLYNRLPRFCRGAFAASIMALVHLATFFKYLVKLQPMIAIAPLLSDRRERGMSARFDNIDWIGGFPFEVASPEILESYCATRGFALIKSKRTTSWGCNELVFQRVTRVE